MKKWDEASKTWVDDRRSENIRLRKQIPAMAGERSMGWRKNKPMIQQLKTEKSIHTNMVLKNHDFDIKYVESGTVRSSRLLQVVNFFMEDPMIW